MPPPLLLFLSLGASIPHPNHFWAFPNNDCQRQNPPPTISRYGGLNAAKNNQQQTTACDRYYIIPVPNWQRQQRSTSQIQCTVGHALGRPKFSASFQWMPSRGCPPGPRGTHLKRVKVKIPNGKAMRGWRYTCCGLHYAWLRRSTCGRR